MLEQLRGYYKETAGLIDTIKYDVDDPFDTSFMSLYATIIEYTQSGLTLLSTDNYVGVESIARSALEALIDLINLNHDAKYLDIMRYSYHHDRMKLAEEGADGVNPYLALFKDNPEIAALLKDAKDQIAALEAAGVTYRQTSIQAKFKRAQLNDMLASVYVSLCGESHNNISALSERHLREDNGKRHLVIFDEPSREALATVVDGFAATLDTANLVAHRRYKSSVLADIEEASRVLNDIRTKHAQAL